MRFRLPALILIASTSLSLAKPASFDNDVLLKRTPPVRNRPALVKRDGTQFSFPRTNVSVTRPNITYHPQTPHNPPPSPPARSKICNVNSFGDGKTDDSQHVLDALNECNNGGHVIFQKGFNYTIGTALDLTFLKHIDIEIQSTIQFTNDTAYWQANSFSYGFQNITSFFKLGGNDVFIYGGGTLDGNGQVWYDAFAANILTPRPVLIGIDGLLNSIISDLVLRSPPLYSFFVANSTNVVFDNIDTSSESTSNSPAKNTDGWNTYRSSDIVIQNSVIHNGDDCVSFKSNSTNILVQNLDCFKSHGISIGSLGQYKGVFDLVENIYVANTTLHSTTAGARIKVWPNAPSSVTAILQGGGGDGLVNNITYDQITVDNVDYAIEIDQCYGQKNLDLCFASPSKVNITNVVFKNFNGTTSSRFAPQIGAFACSSPGACANIVASGINVVSPSGTKDAFCANVDQRLLNVTCSSDYQGFV